MSAAHRLAGSKGGTTTLERHGIEHFAEIGALGGKGSTNKGGSPNGGLAVLAKYGVGYFSQIGKRGGRPRWEITLAKDKELRQRACNNSHKRNGDRLNG